MSKIYIKILLFYLIINILNISNSSENFFNEGIIYKEGFYTFGNPVNTWRFYNEKGELTRVEGF